MSSLLNNNRGRACMQLQHEFGCVCIYTSAPVYIYMCLCLQVKSLYVFNHNTVMQL